MDFSKHTILKYADRWLVQAPDHYDGWFELTFTARESMLVIAGDVDTVVFGRYSPGTHAEAQRAPHERLADLVRWIGDANIVYAAEKAAIGFGSEALVYETTYKTVIEDIKDMRKSCDSLHKTRLDLILARDGLDEFDLVEDLHQALHEADIDDYALVGRRITQRVLTAHEAIRHVAHLAKAMSTHYLPLHVV